MSDLISKALLVTIEVTQTKWSDDSIQFVKRQLNELDEREVIVALHRCARECTYGLRLSDILSRVPSYQSPADSAWNLALRVIRGQMRPNDLDDDAIKNAVAVMGGFKALGMSRETELPRLAMRFKALYRPADVSTKSLTEAVRRALPN